MQILFENGVRIPIELNNSPAQDTLLQMFKHLQHVPVEFLGPDDVEAFLARDLAHGHWRRIHGASVFVRLCVAQIRLK